MKMKFFLLLSFLAKAWNPVGCDPAWLNEYKIVKDDCRNWRGFNTVADKNGVILEKWGNTCARQCKVGNLPKTVQTICKCKRDRVAKVTTCSYQIKLLGVVKGWVAFNHTDSEGKYPLDQNGNGGKQAACVLNEVGTWGNWSEFGSCDAKCGLGEQKRTRECSSGYCGVESAEETRKCLAYEDYTISRIHPCGNEREAMWEIKNEGYHCLFPSFGRGWGEEVIDGEKVQMGVECEGDEAWNYDTYSIAGLNTKCKVVCRGEKGGEYIPKTSEWYKFSCQSPIPVQSLNPEVQNGFTEWMEKGLAMGEPYYFDRQTLPRRECWPKCKAQKSLTWISKGINKCYKVDTEPSCYGMPPLTDFEVEMGTKESGLIWRCSNGDKPGSTCEKSCRKHHIERGGNPRQICFCQGDECAWQRTSEAKSNVVFKSRATSCIMGCDAQPDKVFKNKHYVLTCNQSDLTQPSDSSKDMAHIYQWNWPTPVKINNKCTVKCADNPRNGWPNKLMMEGWIESGVDSFEIQCKKNVKEDVLKWQGDFKKCQKVCFNLTGKGRWDEVEPIWKCTNLFYEGSRCTKSCPDGYKLDNTVKWRRITTVRCTGRGSWTRSSSFKPCVAIKK